MKLSKMRKKARSQFARGRQQYRWDRDQIIRPSVPPPEEGLFTPVAVVRGRVFTKPQCALQKRS